MKIGSLDPKSVVSAPLERRAGASKDAARAEPSAKVALSKEASQLQAASGQDGSFDAEKVKRISQAIRDGKFQVNAEAIADKLISNAREMIGHVGKA